jgi:GT2 family glycosyltransferase
LTSEDSSAELLSNGCTPSLSVVVLHWRDMADTIECLRSLRNLQYPAVKVILVNNGAADFDDESPLRIIPSISIVSSRQNLGFAGGNNLGIAKALKDGADLVLLLNNDAVVRSDLAWSLLPALQDPSVGIVGPIILYEDATDRVWDAGGTYNRLLGYPHRRHPLTIPSHNCRVDYLSGCALLVKREVFETVGMFWDALFLYFEDVEFCLRAGKANFRCMLVREPLVRHKVSASAGKRGSNRFSADKAYYFGRNPFLLLQRHARGVHMLTGFVSQFLLVLPYNVFHYIGPMNHVVLQSHLAGIRDGLLGRWGRKPTSDLMARPNSGNSRMVGD